MNLSRRVSFAGRVCPRFVASATLLLSVLFLCPTFSSAGYPWPREIESRESSVIIYQPQIESYKGNKVTAHAPLSVTKKNENEPAFGVVRFSSRTVSDRETRIIEFVDLTVEDIRFPGLTREQEENLVEFMQREVIKWERTPIALDQFLAAVAFAEREQAASDRLDTDPPKIIFTRKPSVLIVINGKPVLRGVDNTKVERIVNSPYIILYDPASGAYYLKGGEEWFTAADLMGRWRSPVTPPVSVLLAAKKVSEPEQPADRVSQKTGPKTLPDIVVATEPTELIQTDGDLQWNAVPGTDLLYLSNTERDLFLDLRSLQYYVVLAGRWYRSRSLESGPWSYVASDTLPAAFYQIPQDSDKGHVLALVAGTREADEAVIDAQIPQTAAVKRSETKLTVTYDGQPVFEDIKGTDIGYATNTSYQVLRMKGRYYACYQAVWFVSDSPNGPWLVADSIPPDIETIPPESPVYNVKYVYIYDSTPDVVYVGYTPGYVGSFVYGGTLVFGTGYSYPGYVGGAVYYPAPLTWGTTAVYDPLYGYWGYGLGFDAGTFLGFAAGVVTSPWWYGSWWWGYPYANVVTHRHYSIYGSRSVPAQRPFNLTRSLSNPTSIYNHPSNINRAANILTRPQPAPPAQTSERLRTTAQPSSPAALIRGNNVFATRDGGIFRRTDKGWEQRERSGWIRPETRDNLRNNFQTSRPSLERDLSSRMRGIERSTNFERFRGSGLTRSSVGPGSSGKRGGGSFGRTGSKGSAGSGRTK